MASPSIRWAGVSLPAHPHAGAAGSGDGPASVIRTTTALRALELAVIEFSGAQSALLRDTALAMAVAVLDSGPEAAEGVAT